MLRVVTFNVNGIRASVRRGFVPWLHATAPDILALQEVRAPHEQVPPEAYAGYTWTYHPGTLAGRNGVALLTRQEPLEVRYGTGSRQFDREGRYVEVVLSATATRPVLVAGSVYVPKGGTPHDGAASLAKYHRKLRFLAGFGSYLTTRRREIRRAGGEFVVMGDWNIAPGELDVDKPGSKRRSEGFLPAERAWTARMIGPRTFVDVVRALRPDQQGPYSWWSWRGQQWTNDAGWRIDYQLATPGLAASARAGGTDRETAYEERKSDHSPVVVDYEL